MFSSDYAAAKKQIAEKVEELHALEKKPGVNARIEQVQEITDCFVQATGHRPDDHVLNRLGDYILVDYLTDQYKHHKRHDDEFYFQNKKQLAKRQARHKETEYREDEK
ncbi:hypothetical protein HB667_26735 [Bacillus cereus]|uniref:hypothetical protein n=1 Tax=Bacillus cereus group TaxID=86661 RepID=UPI001444876C|nr:hypothetical protein [Bacillus cereus]NKW77411.1 hypothetical protein [Bacillus cereus]NKX14829.1 hypothetical protein [Bacillus cereus]